MILVKQTIQERLQLIEKQENIKILYAVESGSRAWGFASIDSDYDVRFIYVRPLQDYLKLEKMRDVLEYPIDDVLDISGWDLHKTLRLANVSNPTLFEWMHSPIVYVSTPIFEEIKQELVTYFKMKAGLYHYLNMANNTYRSYLQRPEVHIKKYFYAIRPLLACKWILQHESIPPVAFNELVETMLEVEYQPLVNELMEKKQVATEVTMMPPIQELQDYISSNIDSLKQQIDALPYVQGKGYDQLNTLFLKVLNK